MQDGIIKISHDAPKGWGGERYINRQIGVIWGGD